MSTATKDDDGTECQAGEWAHALQMAAASFFSTHSAQNNTNKTRIMEQHAHAHAHAYTHACASACKPTHASVRAHLQGEPPTQHVHAPCARTGARGCAAWKSVRVCMCMCACACACTCSLRLNSISTFTPSATRPSCSMNDLSVATTSSQRPLPIPSSPVCSPHQQQRRHAGCDMQYATCDMRHAACGMRHAAAPPAPLPTTSTTHNSPPHALYADTLPSAALWPTNASHSCPTPSVSALNVQQMWRGLGPAAMAVRCVVRPR